MASSRSTILILGIALCGCRSNKPAPLPPPATPYTAERLQAQYQEIDPSVRVGLVEAVNSRNQLVAVSHLDTSEFHPGEVIGFMDSKKDLIAQGTVVRSVNDFLIVHYTDESRPLREGDLAVHVKM